MRPFPAARSSCARVRVSIALCVAASLFLGSRAYVPSPTIATRAFVITDPEALAPFPFERVAVALGAPQPAVWLEMLTPTPDDPRRPVTMPLNGFIPAPEMGSWRPAAAEAWSHLRPVAIVNRFDLAPADYGHCGEYRLIFSRRTEGRARLNIAIEAVLPNPEPRRGKAGCASVAAFWWELAQIESATARGKRMERFFFRGLPSVPPAFDRRSFAASGRIRTSEISDGRPKFAQFELTRDCAPARPCAKRLARVPLDNMPDAALFNGKAGDERAAAFRREFLRQIPSLSIPDLNRYTMNVDRRYSVRDVDALVPAFNYQMPFRRAQRTAVGREFREQIAEELRKAGSTLQPEDIIGRAETQNCAGCHGKPGPVGGGAVFPNAFEQGEHIAAESLSANARWSPALENVFVPYRIGVLAEYLRTTGAARSEPSSLAIRATAAGR